MTVIVIATTYDLHADAVVDHILKSDFVYRISPEENPELISFEFGNNFFSLQENKVDFDSISGIYCRHAIELGVQSEIDDPVVRFGINEWISTVSGIMLNISPLKWINYPWYESIAEGKIYPLNIASRFGISVPKFIVSNSIKEMDIFLDSQPDSSFVIKSISQTQIALQNNQFVRTPDHSQFYAPYTKKFERNLCLDEMIDDTPFLIQREIIKKSEVRCIVIDKLVMATECEVDNLLSVDVRLKPDRIEKPITLPLDLNEKIISFVNFLNLRFSTLDFSIDEENNYWLTDINPAGNWLWQELQLEMGIPDRIAEALIR